MSSMAPMTPPDSNQQQMNDLKHEMRATLDARRELGPEYDEHFIQALTEKLTIQVRQEVQREMAQAPRRGGNKLDSSQRTGIAICSLIFGIPLIAITAGNPMMFFTVVVMIALINFFAMW